MNDEVFSTIREYNMIVRGDRLLIALSGGADSVALLYFLCALRGEWELELYALHLNHNLRGSESARDERFVGELCARLEVELFVYSEPIAEAARRRGRSVELYARERRYALLEERAAALGAKIATAHTASDSAETLLINLSRGTSLRGLCGIPPVRGRIVRPLIACTRGQVEDYLAARGLEYVTDSSNQSQDYTRNRIRHAVLPSLRALNPRFERQTADMQRLLRRDADRLDELAGQRLRTLLDESGQCRRQAFLALDPAMQARVLLALLEGAGAERNRDRVRQLLECIRAGSGGVQLRADLFFRCGAERFGLEGPRDLQPYFRADIHLADLAQADADRVYSLFQGKAARVRVEEIPNFNLFKENSAKVLKNVLDCDKMSRIVSIRQRQPGDRLRIPGRGCSKTLKNLFQEAGIPPAERARRAVLADEAGVRWVEGFGPDESALADETSRRVLIIVLEDVRNG